MFPCFQVSLPSLLMLYIYSYCWYRCQVNIMRNTAISFSACVTAKRNLEDMIHELRTKFNVRLDGEVELITIRHYSSQMIEEMIREKIVLMEEKISKTIQLVVQNTPMMTRRELTVH